MKDGQKIKNILFVCTGNTCRSPMAEGIFQKILREKTTEYPQYKIYSAGIFACNGMPPTREALQVMSELGIDISRHKSQPINESLLRKADLIFTMTGEQQEYLHQNFPWTKGKTYLLKEYYFKNHQDRNIKNNLNIVDPLGHPVEYYRLIAEELILNLSRIAEIIIQKNSQ
ncbi:MAG: low molecular weight protein arginine phosphatase [Candidatus Caldatribacteriota bacterium]